MSTTYKNFLGGKDVKWWDGLMRTFTRLTSTGGQLTQNKIGDYVDVVEVYGNGTDYNATTLNLAIKTLSSVTGAVLRLKPGTWTIDAAVTVPANLTLEVPHGAMITKSSTGTLTINGPFFAGLYQVFSGFSAGGVTFGTGVVKVYPEWWGITGMNDDVAINAALQSVKAVNGLRVWADTSWDYGYGGIPVILSAKTYTTGAVIEVPTHGTLAGAGKRNTIISSSFNGQIVRNQMDASVYDFKSIEIRDFTVKGDRTKTSQVGIDFLRVDFSRGKNITVENSGGNGINLRQCIGTKLESTEVIGCVGDGIKILGGVNSWTDLTVNNLPSNANFILNPHTGWNDGTGIRITNSNGNTVEGGASENNYLATASYTTGYQIEIDGTSRQNTFDKIWCEGAGLAHFHQNLTDTGAVNRLINFTHYGNGVTGNVSRAVIVDNGSLYLDHPVSHGAAYRTINGSSAPFRLNKANAAHIYLTEASQGGTWLQVQLIEDENGNTANLTNYMTQNFNYGSTIRRYGLHDFYVDFGNIGFNVYATTGAGSTTWDSIPIFRVRTYNPKGIEIYGFKIVYSGAAPTSGTWSAGDRVLNWAPAVGQPKSWVCTVAGTPGTWVSEGNL